MTYKCCQRHTASFFHLQEKKKEKKKPCSCIQNSVILHKFRQRMIVWVRDRDCHLHIMCECDNTEEQLQPNLSTKLVLEEL